MFQKATRKQARLRLALTGPSGSGKTYGALLIAKGLGCKTAVIDTERGSASLYSNNFDFDVLEIAPPYAPERFIAAIKAAEEAGYGCIIVDSATHEWSGTGGCLEINERLAASSYRGNTWSAWNETTPRHRAFIDAMVQSKAHVIATGRSKTETAQQENNGKKSIVKLGIKTEQRDGFEYEFTVVLDIVHDGHWATASKDRTGLFSDKDPNQISEKTGLDLLDWLNSGESEKEAIDRIKKSISQAETVDAITSALKAAVAMYPLHKAEFVAAATTRKNEIEGTTT
jgi:AAA domain